MVTCTHVRACNSFFMGLVSCPMALIKFIVGNIPVEVDNADLAVSLLQKLNAQSKVQPAAEAKYVPAQPGMRRIKLTPRPHNVPNVVNAPIDDGDLAFTQSFMVALSKATGNGAESDIIAKALGIEPKGIGSRLRAVKKILSTLGYENAETVFDRAKIPGVGRFWRRGPDFNAAFGAVQMKVKNS